MRFDQIYSLWAAPFNRDTCKSQLYIVFKDYFNFVKYCHGHAEKLRCAVKNEMQLVLKKDKIVEWLLGF